MAGAAGLDMSERLCVELLQNSGVLRRLDRCLLLAEPGHCKNEIYST